MPRLQGVAMWDQYVLRAYGFAVHNLAISQTALVLKRGVNDATTGALLNVGVPAINSGYIVGITANLLAVITHVTLSLSPSIAAAEVASTSTLYRQGMAVATPSIINAFVDWGDSTLRFAKGQLLGMMVTTDAAFLPNGTADLDAELWVMYDPVEF
jgi:hypothetical protein